MPHSNIVFPLLALLLLGCPAKQDDSGKAADLQPTSAIPAEDPLLNYEGLQLGMSNLEISQVFNAPKGKGEGFTRGVQDFGDARNHIIDFDKAKDQPTRQIVLRVYQDKLALVVDRRDGLTEKQATEWLERINKSYGPPKTETLSGAQWVWGNKDAVSLTYTQDNNSPTDMSANVVLQHAPTVDASKRYTQYREIQQ